MSLHTRSLRRAFLAVTALLVGASAVVALRPASAYPADSRHQDAINRKANDLGLLNAVRFGGVVVHDGPDGQPGMDGTPDGRGGFVFMDLYGYDQSVGRVHRGPMAIYGYDVTDSLAHALTWVVGEPTGAGGVRAAAVANAFLHGWGARGWENGIGYPLHEARWANDTDVQNGCAPGEKAQYFATMYGDGITLLCGYDDAVVHEHRIR